MSLRYAVCDVCRARAPVQKNGKFARHPGRSGVWLAPGPCPGRGARPSAAGIRAGIAWGREAVANALAYSARRLSAAREELAAAEALRRDAEAAEADLEAWAAEHGIAPPAGNSAA